MDKMKASQILNELSQLRDRSLEFWSPDDVVQQFFRTNLNIFTSTFFFGVVELVEQAEKLDEIYIAYFRTRNSPARFLIEQYLTYIHVAAMSEADRFDAAYRYLLSGKLSIHKLDLQLQKIAQEKLGDKQPLGIEEKLNVNREGYRDFIIEYGKIGDLMPDDIDSYFEGTNIVPNFLRRFGFNHYQHGKINYMGEILMNPLISEFAREFLAIQYPLLSLDVHPTHNSVVDFEQFISKKVEAKRELALGRNGASAANLCLVGNEMIHATKELLSREKAV